MSDLNVNGNSVFKDAVKRVLDACNSIMCPTDKPNCCDDDNSGGDCGPLYKNIKTNVDKVADICDPTLNKYYEYLNDHARIRCEIMRETTSNAIGCKFEKESKEKQKECIKEEMEYLDYLMNQVLAYKQCKEATKDYSDRASYGCLYYSGIVKDQMFIFSFNTGPFVNPKKGFVGVSYGFDFGSVWRLTKNWLLDLRALYNANINAIGPTYHSAGAALAFGYENINWCVEGGVDLLLNFNAKMLGLGLGPFAKVSWRSDVGKPAFYAKVGGNYDTWKISGSPDFSAIMFYFGIDIPVDEFLRLP